MAEIHKLKAGPIDILMEELINLKDIEEVICIIKHKNGDISVADTKASFEFKCTSVKLLDFEILEELRVDSED